MGKIIVDNRSSLSDMIALRRVAQVVADGRISNNGRDYCYFTNFDDCEIDSFRNAKSDRFVVWDLFEGFVPKYVEPSK